MENRFFTLPFLSISCFTLFILLIANDLHAQYKPLGTWNIFNATYHIAPKWSLFGEAQVRSLHFYNQFHYYEYKGGFLYRINPNARIGLVLGSYQTYQTGGNFLEPKRNDEFRIWPQAILTQSIAKLKIEQRYRFEMRFTSDGYRNRFRYRLNVSYPIGKEKNGIVPFTVGIANEVFFTDQAPYFIRNRFMPYLQYRCSKNLSFLLGDMQQLDYSINNPTSHGFLQIGIYWEIFRPSKNASTAEHLNNSFSSGILLD